MFNEGVFGSGTSLLWIMGESAGSVAIGDGYVWKVTCDMSYRHIGHETCHMMFLLSGKRCQKSYKKSQKMQI